MSIYQTLCAAGGGQWAQHKATAAASHVTSYWRPLPETSAKVQVWHREQSRARTWSAKALPGPDKSSSLHCSPSKALCLGYWCKAPSLLQTTTFALCLCRQVPKNLIQKSDQGSGLWMLDQPCQCDLEIQESYWRLCAAGLISLSTSEKCYIKSADTCKE